MSGALEALSEDCSGWGGVTAAPCVTQTACGPLAPVAFLQPYIPVCAGSSGPQRRLGQGIPNVLISDLRL